MSSEPLIQKKRHPFTFRTVIIMLWLIAICTLIWYRIELSRSAVPTLYGLPMGYLEPLEVPPLYKWIASDQLAFITLLTLWLFFLPFGKVPVMQGILFSLGMVLLIVILNWLIYRTDDWLLIILALILFFVLYLIRVRIIVPLLLSLCLILLIGLPHRLFYSEPPQVSREEFDIAKRQTVLRMSRDWADNNYLQPYDCDSYEPNQIPYDPLLAHISFKLKVNLVLCKSSSWKEPGAILVWKDMFGTHTDFIFGAPWLLFQEYYMSLGLPTSEPYMAPNNRIAQDFGVTMRIMYEPKKSDDELGVAWIQQRYSTLLNYLPNIFCLEILHTPTNQSCWQPMTAEGVSVYHSEHSFSTSQPEDWLMTDYIIPLEGWWAPLNTWKALFMAEVMCFVFILLIPFRQSLMTMWIQFACMGKLVMFLFFFGLAILMIVSAFTYLYSNPNNILNDLQIPQLADLNLEAGFNPLNPMDQFSKLMVNWFEYRSLFTLQEQTGQPWREIVRLWVYRGLWIATGLSLGLILMPLWVGLMVGGPMGGWIGLFILFGMVIALESFAPLKSFGSFTGQWLAS